MIVHNVACTFVIARTRLFHDIHDVCYDVCGLLYIAIGKKHLSSRMLFAINNSPKPEKDQI